MIKLTVFFVGILYCTVSFSQSQLVNQGKHNDFTPYFGIQVRPVFPIGLVEPTQYLIGKNGLETRISQKSAFSFGGVIRMQMTPLFGLETGIHYTRRHFNMGASIPDSSISVEGDMTFVHYEVPINALVSIKLNDKVFMTSSMGGSIFYKPTDAHDLVHANERHSFLFYAHRNNKFLLGLNASLGFEYRTKESGIFCLGGSASVPLSPIFEFELLHGYDANLNSIFAQVDGSFISFDLKYFFPIIENKGKQFVRGPIE